MHGTKVKGIDPGVDIGSYADVKPKESNLSGNDDVQTAKENRK